MTKRSASGDVKKAGHWSQGLRDAMEDPNAIVESFEDMVIIRDKYPKSTFHFLVLPKESIPSLRHLKPKDIPLLEKMEARGSKYMRGKCSDFRCGFHALPSMSQLHLHVISQDFDSPSLKTKKHWNTFTTEYFVDSKDVISRLKDEGVVNYDRAKYEGILKRDLRCHKCSAAQKTMPALKEHLKQHF